MAIYNYDYLTEAYKSKYSSYLNDSDDDNEEDEDDDSSSKPQSTPSHLSKPEIRRIITLITSILVNFPKLKKCCDYVDLEDKDHINDDGERESSFGKYYNENPKSFIELINGDVFSGYPNFRSGGNDDYEKDEREFIKQVNKLFEEKDIKAKFMSGPNRDDDAISFGVKSIKEK